MSGTVEQVTVVRSSLDPSNFESGITRMEAAAKRGAETIVTSNVKAAGSWVTAGDATEKYVRQMNAQYDGAQKYARAYDAITKAVDANRIAGDLANTTLERLAAKYGVVSAAAQQMAAAMREIEVRTAAANDAMNRASQAQSAFNARSGAPGVSAPVIGTVAPGVNATGGDPLYGGAYAARQSDLEAYGAALDATKARYVPLFAAAQSYEQELAAISAALANGSISESDASNARQAAINSYRDARLAANDYAKAQQDAAAAANDALLGVKNPNAAATAARGADVNAAFADADRQRASVDQLFAVSKQYEASYNTINNLKKTGVYNDAQEEAAIDRLNAGYKSQIDVLNKSTDAHGHLSGATAGVTREFIVMAHEVLTGNYTRIPGSILVLSERMGGLRDIIKGVASFAASPAGLGVLAGVAGVGALAALTIAAEDTSLRIERLRNAISLVRPDFVAAAADAETVARALARTTTLNIDQARAGAAALYSANGGFGGSADQAQTILNLFTKYNIVAGDAADDTKLLGAAMRDGPSKALEEMAPRVSSVNQILINHVRQLESAGDRAGAWKILLDQLGLATQHYTDTQTPLEKAMNALHNAFAGASRDGKGFAQVIGEELAKSLADVVTGAAHLVEALNNIDPSKLKTVLGSLWDIYSRIPGIGLPGQIWNGLSGAAGAIGNIPLPSGTASAQLPGGADTITGAAASVMTAVHDFFVSNNLSEAATASILTNISKESGFDPSLWNKAHTSYGLFQYDQSGGRLQQLQKFAGTAEPDLQTQLQFMLREITTGAYKNVGQALSVLPNTPAGAAAGSYMFTADFENPKDAASRAAERAPLAPGYLARFGPGASQVATGDPEGGPTSPGYAAATDAATNASNAFNATVQQTAQRLEDLRKQFDPTADKARGLAADAKFLSTAFNENGDIVRNGQVVYHASKDELDAYQRALKEVGGAIEFNRTPQEQMLHGLQLQSDLTQQVTEGDRRRATLVQQLNELERQHPGTQSADDQSRAIAALNREQEGQLRQAEYGIDQQIIGNKDLAAAYLISGTAVEDAKAKTQAFAEASKLFPAGSPEWHAAFTRLTDDYRKASLAAAEMNVARQIQTNANAIEYLQAETGALGMNDAARTVMLAHLKAEQDLKAQGIPLDSEYARKLLATTDALAAQGHAFNDMKSSLDAVAGAFSQSFDTIGNAMAQAFVQGNGAAVNWQNVMTGVVQQVIQQFIKLSVLNPILNNLFGQNNPTLSTLGNAISGQAANGTGLGGMLSGTWFGNLLGLGGSAANGTAFAGLSSASASAFAGLGGTASGASAALAAAPGGFLAHTGGVIGVDPLPIRYVHPAYFDNAPRLHAGTPLGADEFTAILQRGERVLTDRQQTLVKAAASGGDGGVHFHGDVNIYPPPGADKQAMDTFGRSMPGMLRQAMGTMGRAAARQS